ncbi:hypothetical protein [Endozoicomonas sp. ALC066]|uniref:hypothetical protein n=1 Tax=Endozoicomonas sp. ALC066 TaxID=3403078 RepID=UPI003BB7808A
MKKTTVYKLYDLKESLDFQTRKGSTYSLPDCLAKNIELIKLYQLLDYRNQWVDWNGNTDIVEGKRFLPKTSLESTKKIAQSISVQGTRFKIVEQPGFLITNNKKLKTIITSNSWEKKLTPKTLKLSPRIIDIANWFEFQTKGFYYHKTINFSEETTKFDIYDSLYEYSSNPKSNAIDWKSKKVNFSKDNYLEAFRDIQERILNQYR